MHLSERIHMRHTSTSQTSIARYMLIAALAALAPLKAQSFDVFKLGFVGSFAVPAGDLKNMKTWDSNSVSGFGGGAFLEMSMHQNFALRGRLEYTSFTESSGSSSSSSSSSSQGVATCFSATAEVMLRQDSGLYFFGGVGYLMPKLNDRFGSPDLDGGMAVSAGVGYYPPILRGLGFETKYTKSMSVKRGDNDFAFDGLQLSVTYRLMGRGN
jgi:hypothetical protein